MTDFFANMINRHLGAAEIVKPRARARFEPENRIATMDIPDSLETEQDFAWREDRDHHTTHGSAGPESNVSDKKNKPDDAIIQGQPSTVLAGKKSLLGAASRAWELDDRVETLLQRLRSLQNPQPEISNNSQIPSFRRRPESSFPPEMTRETPASGSVSGAGFTGVTARDEVSRGVQPSASGADCSESSDLFYSYFDRSPRSRLSTNGPNAMDSNKLSVRPGPVEGHLPNKAADKLFKQPVSSLPQEARRPATDKKPEPAISSIAPTSRHSGLLEPPSWFSQMQAEFSRRWQEMNSKPEAEPVINVTIGRVEVRAVQPELPKQPKRKNKPTGVMSLDEYLNQRGRGGRI